jgi:hypothetical protein
MSAVTKSLSGAARATIDACRTVFIWLYALHAGWESFHALEVVGFVVLISGTSLYNEIIKTCLPGGLHPTLLAWVFWHGVSSMEFPAWSFQHGVSSMGALALVF